MKGGGQTKDKLDAQKFEASKKKEKDDLTDLNKLFKPVQSLPKVDKGMFRGNLPNTVPIAMFIKPTPIDLSRWFMTNIVEVFLIPLKVDQKCSPQNFFLLNHQDKSFCMRSVSSLYNKI